jgi:hypothetical protein
VIILVKQNLAEDVVVYIATAIPFQTIISARVYLANESASLHVPNVKAFRITQGPAGAIIHSPESR